MNKLIKSIIAVAALFALSVGSVNSQEYGINWGRKAFHVTTNTTNNVVAVTARLQTLVIQVSGAGTAWVITVQNKEGTPKILYQYLTAQGVGTFTVPLPVGVLMTSGIDVITTGTTPGVADVFVTYR